MELVIGWLMIGVGVTLGLLVNKPKHQHEYIDNLIAGIVLAILFWPLALWNNRSSNDKH